MKPYFDDGHVQIWHGDCREILPTLNLEVDVLLTDPPYGIVNRFGTQIADDGGRRTLEFAWDGPEIADTVVSGITAALPLVAKVGSCFVFVGLDIVERVFAPVRAAGFTVKPACWVKECPPPPGMGNWWPSGFELAFYGYRNSPYFGDTRPNRSNVFVSDSYRYGQPGKVDHPTQKPLGLITRIAESLIPRGGMVLDPFMGSGTTLRAAKDLGRKAIGIEIEERYCEIAAKRMAQTVMAF